MAPGVLIHCNESNAEPNEKSKMIAKGPYDEYEFVFVASDDGQQALEKGLPLDF